MPASRRILKFAKVRKKVLRQSLLEKLLHKRRLRPWTRSTTPSRKLKAFGSHLLNPAQVLLAQASLHICLLLKLWCPQSNLPPESQAPGLGQGQVLQADSIWKKQVRLESNVSALALKRQALVPS
jgi:hypothetical protein